MFYVLFEIFSMLLSDGSKGAHNWLLNLDPTISNAPENPEKAHAMIFLPAKKKIAITVFKVNVFPVSAVASRQLINFPRFD